MKNLSLVRFKSEGRETPFAPHWDYRLIEGEIDDVDFDYIARYLLNKKNEILKIKPSKGDGFTGLGMNSTTARHSDYNIFNFGDDEINKLKSNIYNLGLSSANISKLMLAKKIKKNMKGLKIKIITNRKDPDKRDYFVSNEKIEKKGFKAKTLLSDGIKELVNYFSTSDFKLTRNY